MSETQRTRESAFELLKRYTKSEIEQTIVEMQSVAEEIDLKGNL
ncbi:hypothetical protein Calhy_1568 [Caldicellulosiruptor hydrothermalis 108]|uniref:Uncharacterized protein n=1 Tax=Caldicellulosiruptor hydrothermalis (strain DSM 18901 / VKM B-2411 / 108) TaxID=632292 RepID=E4QBR8_CALH1|nr:hypothetical protein [Caldicellulosiruptor hydrothermalis]ADQ07284.1 hypothetical protein Calhy_1568 [Caldicellulosiruptor hydrothermalis 108]